MRNQQSWAIYAGVGAAWQPVRLLQSHAGGTVDDILLVAISAYGW
jgi:hypothetical protein